MLTSCTLVFVHLFAPAIHGTQSFQVNNPADHKILWVDWFFSVVWIMRSSYNYGTHRQQDHMVLFVCTLEHYSCNQLSPTCYIRCQQQKEQMPVWCAKNKWCTWEKSRESQRNRRLHLEATMQLLLYCLLSFNQSFLALSLHLTLSSELAITKTWFGVKHVMLLKRTKQNLINV